MSGYCCKPAKLPGVKACLEKKCPDLGKQEWPPGSGKFRRVCVPAGNRIPGNIVCPKEKGNGKEIEECQGWGRQST